MRPGAGAAALLALTLAALAPQPARAAVGVFQLEAAFAGAMPTGSYADGTQASDQFETGPGFMVTGSLGLTRTLFLAARSGYHRNTDEEHVIVDDGTVAGTRLGPNRSEAVIFEAFVERKLATVPTHVLLQYRRPFGRLSLYGEGGIGLAAHTLDLTITLPGPGGLVIEDHGRQTSFSWTLGAGFAVGLGRHLDVVTGFDYQHAQTSSGELWSDGDDPTFLTATIGLRYPRN